MWFPQSEVVLQPALLYITIIYNYHDFVNITSWILQVIIGFTIISYPRSIPCMILLRHSCHDGRYDKLWNLVFEHKKVQPELPRNTHSIWKTFTPITP